MESHTYSCLTFTFGVCLLSLDDRKTILQATVFARNSKVRYYLGLIFAVVFFGGFLFKSWNDQRVFDRDTERILAYYKNVVPGSFQDGDQHNARYLVYKYKNKKDKLWKRLETKYGEPVLHAHEWPEPEETTEEEEVVENLDEEADKDNESSDDKPQEPDL